jgi:hypothetical protein
MGLLTLDRAGGGGSMNGYTFDRATTDSTGAFLVGQLERLDMVAHEPLANITYPRDIDLREDITIADDVSSYTIESYASAGGALSTGIAWAGKEGDSASVVVDIGKNANPLIEWSLKVQYTIRELQSSISLGKPLDMRKYSAMLLKHQMDTDQMVYIGDTNLGSTFTGMVNSAAVTAASVATGASGSTLWSKKTPDEILADVNATLSATWVASGLAVFPDRYRIPPAQMAYIGSQKVSTAGNVTILEFLRKNTLCNVHNGKDLDIQAVKWLVGEGVGGTPQVAGTVDRSMAYTRDINKIRYPMTLLQRSPISYQGRKVLTDYFNTLGVVEVVYPECVYYSDGI